MKCNKKHPIRKHMHAKQATSFHQRMYFCNCYNCFFLLIMTVINCFSNCYNCLNWT
jgi:hypothetical protein